MRPRFVTAVLIISVLIAPAFGQEVRHTLFPQVAVGAGFSCDFVITNQGFLPVNGLTLSFFAENGSPMVVASTDQGSNSSFNFNLPAGGSYILKLTRTGDTIVGYADLTAPSGSTVVGTLTVRWETGGQVATQLGVSQQFPFEHFSFAGKVGPNVNTGIAIVNATLAATAPAAQDILISLIDKNGAIVRSTVLRLETGQHVSKFLVDPIGGGLFSGLTDFEGTVSVSGQNPFGLLALRQESASLALGTVAINEGPVLAPFLLSNTPTAEVENNDQRTSAQAVTLPVVISGAIANSADQDYYRFQGNAGDILVAMVETQTQNSDLDSELWLIDANGNAVTMNDQNGVYPQDDSAIKMVLPATGTYYLFVWDFRETLPSSTIGFGYRLHAKVVSPTSLF